MTRPNILPRPDNSRCVPAILAPLGEPDFGKDMGLGLDRRQD